MTRLVDETMHTCMLQHAARSAATPLAAAAASSALTLLASSVERLGAHAPPWALNAAGERMARVLAMGACPAEVRAAAGHAMGRLQPLRKPAET